MFQYPRLDVWNAQLHGIGFDNVLGVVDLSRAHYREAGYAPRFDGAAPGTLVVRPFRGAGIVFSAAVLLLAGLVWRRFGSAYS